MPLMFDGIMAKAERVCRVAASVDGIERASEIALVEGLDDAALLSLSEASAELVRAAESIGALVAGEIEHRSRRELGHSGLAQRSGHRTAGDLVRSINKSSMGDATRLVRVGRSMIESGSAPAPSPTSSATPEADADTPPRDRSDTAPWLAAVAMAVLAGRLSAAQADSIRRGLGTPADGVDVSALAAEAERLVKECWGAHADQLFTLAKQARDDIDAAGIAQREDAMRESRFLNFFRQPDGMWRMTGLFDPESAAIARGFLDAMTSPRRGGPRFVGKAERAEAEAITNDPRTTQQLLLDTLVDAFRLASQVSPSTMVGSRRASVRILTAETELNSPTGHGHIEGIPEAVSIETVERFMCDTGWVATSFDRDGQCVNVGREQRLFTARQRIGLAARDNGCGWPGCDRPPSWTEAHHIDEWHADHGHSDIADGLLLCRFHHLLLHNRHWRIIRRGGQYALIPPKDEPEQSVRVLDNKSPALRDLMRARSREAAVGERNDAAN
ncbi:MAG: DUF222 domain-containing protein [Microbacteriaceae bacterium]